MVFVNEELVGTSRQTHTRVEFTVKDAGMQSIDILSQSVGLRNYAINLHEGTGSFTIKES